MHSDTVGRFFSPLRNTRAGLLGDRHLDIEIARRGPLSYDERGPSHQRVKLQKALNQPAELSEAPTSACDFDVPDGKTPRQLMGLHAP